MEHEPVRRRASAVSYLVTTRRDLKEATLHSHSEWLHVEALLQLTPTCETMTRVVQDSDDELEEDLEIELLPSKQPNASGQPLSNDTPHGTGSTGMANLSSST